MSAEKALKRKIALMLGTSVLATTLVVAPVMLGPDTSNLMSTNAFAKGGGEGGGDSDSGDSGEGSGSGNSGSGSGNSGESSSSGQSGENSQNRRGKGRKGRNRAGRNRNASIPGRFGRVVSSKIRGRHIEVYYSDGWKEGVKGGSYRLKDPRDRTIVERPARASDFNRISRAISNAKRK